LDQILATLMQNIKKKVEKKTAAKKGFRKKIKTQAERRLRGLARCVFNDPTIRVKRCTQHSELGCDDLGRDIKDGLRLYVRILKARNFRVHTVLVLGSRAKGSWKPTSDVDVTIIVENLPKEGKNPLTKRLFGLRRALLLSDRPIYLGVETSGCCSREEFLNRLEHLDIQALDAVFYGRVIYDDGFWQTAVERYRQIEGLHKLNQILLKEILLPV